MPDDLTATLRTHFRFESFRPGQAEAIENLLAGRNTLAVMPTGSGKSLIYQLAALRRPGVTLVVSPLIALMKDQVDGLTRRGIPATFINSALSAHQHEERLQRLAAGAFRLVYVAPERLRSVSFLQALSSVTVGLLAVDEAHCISQWGHDFRPDYLHVAAARHRMGGPVTVALTATATPRVQDDIVRLLGLSSAQRLITGFNRPNLQFEVRYTANVSAKLQALRALLAERDGGGAIIYTGTRRDTEEVAEFVQTVCGIAEDADLPPFYHAGLDAPARSRVQEAFLAGELPVVVATNAFGMGIDRPDVRLVAHYALPSTLEAYYQEAGRAGRDGAAARAVLLYDPRDRALQEWFIDHDAPTVDELRALFDALGAPQRAVVRRTTTDLSRATGLHETRVKVGLAQLESAGILQHLGDEGPWLLLRPGAWDAVAAGGTAAGVEEHRRRRRAQLAQVIAYAEANACRRRILLDHFGDRSADGALQCCDNCLTRAASPPSTVAVDPSSLSPGERTALLILDTLRSLKWEVGRRKLAQVLNGSRARDMKLFGYDRGPHYGRLAGFTVREIEGLIERLVREGHVKVIGGELPVLRLTPKGEAAVRTRAPIPLRLPRPLSEEAIARKQAEREAGGTFALTRQMVAEGLTPAQIAARRELGEETIYGHLARMIADGTLSLPEVIPDAVAAQVRTAVEQVGDVSALSPIKALLPAAISYGQIRCVLEAWKRDPAVPRTPEARQEDTDALTPIQQAILECVRAQPGRLPRSGVARVLVGSPSTRVEAYQDHPLHGWLYGWLYGRRRGEVMREVDWLIERGVLTLNGHGNLVPAPPAGVEKREPDAIAAFLSRSHPRPLPGSWHAGWALDFHSRFAGSDWSRGRVGELAYRLKYQGDRSALDGLVAEAAALCARHPELADVDALVPVPPSTPRHLDPVAAFAARLGTRLGRPVLPALAKTRPTAAQKEMRSLAQKRANVAGAFAVRGEVRGERLLVVDDLYDSGATLEEVTRVLHQAGATRVCVLTLTRTIHTDA